MNLNMFFFFFINNVIMFLVDRVFFCMIFLVNIEFLVFLLEFLCFIVFFLN